MNSSELAENMLLWEKNQRANDALGIEIEAEVVKLEKTQVVGGCRVTYSKGRNTYDYETPAKDAPEEAIVAFTDEIKKVDWDAVVLEVPEVVERHTRIELFPNYQAICKAANIAPLVVSTSPASAKIKLE